MKSFNQIRLDLNRSVTGIYERNIKVLDDLAFAHIPRAQWSGSDSEQYANKPKPENNKIARQINRILGQYQKLEINAKIIPSSNDASMQNAKMLENLWRNDINMVDGIEAFQNAADEAFFGGFGAYKIVSEYDDPEEPDPDCQHLSIQPIYSAASSVFFDEGALKKDKSDATQGWHLVRCNRNKLEEEYGSVTSLGEQVSFFDYDFDINRDIYIAHYYEVVDKTEKVYDFGFMKLVKKGRKYYDNFNNIMDEEQAKLIISANEHEMMTRHIKVVEYALLDGNGFLEKTRKTPFKRVPLIPEYGYHTVINGIEYYLGEVARQRDNQRFLNMAYSAMMQILAENQVQKPEYAPEQVQRHQKIYERMNVDDFAYYLSDPLKDQDGKIAHLGPTSMHEPPVIGTGLAGVISFLNSNVDEQGGTGQTSVSANVATATVQQVNDRADDSYQKLFQNAMQSIRSGCQTWIDAAKEIYFSNPRKLRMQNQDDTFSFVDTMQYGVDNTDSISMCVNDGKGKYQVVIKTGQSYLSKKEAARTDALEVLQYTDTSSEVGQMALLDVILNSPSETNPNLIKLVKSKQFEILISNGIMPEVETPEDKQLIQITQQRLQQAQATPEEMIAQAQVKKAEADKEKADAVQRSVGVHEYDAQTKRLKVVQDATKLNADTQRLHAEAVKKTIETLETLKSIQQVSNE